MINGEILTKRLLFNIYLHLKIAFYKIFVFMYSTYYYRETNIIILKNNQLKCLMDNKTSNCFFRRMTKSKKYSRMPALKG